MLGIFKQKNYNIIVCSVNSSGSSSKSCCFAVPAVMVCVGIRNRLAVATGN